MSALTDLFSAMANKIRSKTGTATTYTPSEMVSDGIDDVYDAGVASATTPITPSNSTPASMTANTGYKPTANGYAISSYSSVTPSSTQTAVSSGDIVKIGGSGVIVDSVPTPTSITPSNASPVALTADTPVNPTTSGYAIASYSSISPSNSSPATITSGNIYKASANGVAVDSVTNIVVTSATETALSYNANYHIDADSLRAGYIIGGYTSKTPSDTSPASVSSGAIIKASSAGYLVKNTPVNLGAPDLVSQANMSSNTSRSITVTKLPRYIVFVLIRTSDSNARHYIWLYDVGKNTYEYINYTGDGYGYSSSTGSGPITATSSSVTVNNNIAATCRSHALIYY